MPPRKFGDIGGKKKSRPMAAWKGKENSMIPVTKEQAAYLRRLYPGVHITTLCRKKSKGRRKRRLAEEYSAVQEALRAFARPGKNGKEVESRGTKRTDVL